MSNSKLYVGNLSYLTGEEKLRETFSAYGNVSSITIIEGKGFARYAMKTSARILKEAAAIAPEERKSEEFRILIKGLSYSLSVLAARLPDEGFALFERWAAVDDRDIRRVLMANLKKQRLKAVDPERTAGLLRDLLLRTRAASTASRAMEAQANQSPR